MTVWSSIRNKRLIGILPAQHDGRAAADDRRYVQCGTDRERALSHSDQAQVTNLRGWRGDFIGLHTGAVVADRQEQLAGVTAEVDGDVARLSVLQRIVGGFSRDHEGSVFDVRWP